MKPTCWRHLRASSPRERDGQDECIGYFAAGLTAGEIVCTAPGLRTWIMAMSSAQTFGRRCDRAVLSRHFARASVSPRSCIPRANEKDFRAPLSRRRRCDRQRIFHRRQGIIPGKSAACECGQKRQKAGFLPHQCPAIATIGGLKHSNDGHFARFGVR